jgi:hypothetical protein
VKRPRAVFRGRSRHGSLCPLSCHGRGPELSPLVLHQTGLGWPGGRCDNYRKVQT